MSEMNREPIAEDGWEQKVQRLIDAKGSSLKPKEFHALINVVFHNVEARVYDQVHREMWKSLELLTQTLSVAAKTALGGRQNLVLADIGCGTGLATELLLRGSLSDQIKQIHLVDTSDEMLNRCKLRAKSWNRELSFHHGGIHLLPDQSVDVLLLSSVLHHIPDTKEFCLQVSRVIKPGGVFIHMQDPRSGGMADQILTTRAQQFAEVNRSGRFSWKTWPRLFRLPFSAIARVNLWRKQAYIREVNRNLLAAGAIKAPMSPAEIWSVTDVHVEGLPFAIGKGISLEVLSNVLPEFGSIEWKTYAFFGVLSAGLPKQLIQEDQKLFKSGDMHGAQIAGVWAKQRHT